MTPPPLSGLPPDEPLRAVRSSEVLTRPGGGLVEIVTLECGHVEWRRRSSAPTRPPRPRRCTSCWLDAARPSARTTRTGAPHDHYDGSSNCRECGGRCRLEGAERHLTNVVRWYFETQIAGGRTWVPPIMVGALESAGVDVAYHQRRAVEANAR